MLLSDACVAMYRYRTVDVTSLRFIPFIPACDDTVNMCYGAGEWLPVL